MKIIFLPFFVVGSGGRGWGGGSNFFKLLLLLACLDLVSEQ